MKLTKFFILFFTSILVLSSISQLFSSFYLADETFTNEFENHLSSIVNIKSERLNDYLLERTQDTLILSNSNSIQNIFDDDLVFNLEISKNNINSQLNILAKQINIFISRNPYLTLSQLQKNQEFKSLFVKTIGISGSSIIVELDSKNIIHSFNKNHIGDTFSHINDGFYSDIIDTRVKTSDGYSIGITALAYNSDFKILPESTYNLKISLDNFAKISNYENLILISPDDYVVYQFNENYELGSNLKFSNTELSLAYSKVYDLSNQLNQNKISVIGPYFETDKVDAKLVLSFGIPIYSTNNFLGTLILLVEMDKINEIVGEQNNFGVGGETYLIDNNEFLITKLKNQNFDLLVQKVQTQNSQKCLTNNDINKLSYYENLNGEMVLGNYGLIDSTNWCIITEINYQNILNKTKSGQLLMDLVFIIILLLILVTNIIILKNSLIGYNLKLNPTISKDKLLVKFGIYFYLSSKILYMVKTQFYQVTIITIPILFITILELIGLILIFYSIKEYARFRK